MATAPALVSLHEYLQTAYHPDCDFVDGHIEDRNLGERAHARLQVLIAGWFISNERSWNVYSMVGATDPGWAGTCANGRCVPGSPQCPEGAG